MQIRGFRSLITFITFEYLNSHNVTIKMYTIRIYIAGLYDFFSTINYGGFKICVATAFTLHQSLVWADPVIHITFYPDKAEHRLDAVQVCSQAREHSETCHVLCLSSHNRDMSVFYEAWILKIVEGTTCLCTVCHSRYLKIKNSKM